MFENTVKLPTAVLAAVDTGEYDPELSLDELEELVKTAGAQVVARITQKRPEPDTATCMGIGRLREAAEFCAQNAVDLLVFDRELSGSQLRNIEEICGVTVLDRTTVILDIFAQRARSREGALQVELAQLRYRLPRLMGTGTQLSRLGGGIGTRGPGESKLESDRRHIRRRIQALEEQLEAVKQRRETLRGRRRKDGVTTVAIVGYTNAGKSTLLNRLTDAGVLAEDMLFATLDPTARALTLPDGRTILLIDTVGLISRLPHHLVDAFRSTLEEAAYADLLLNICDSADPNVERQIEVTRSVLADLGITDTPVLTVFNKCDKAAQIPMSHRENACVISALTGFGIEEMLQKIAALLQPTQKRMRLLIPYTQSGLISEIREAGRVFSENFTADGTELDALVDVRLLKKVSDYQQ